MHIKPTIEIGGTYWSCDNGERVIVDDFFHGETGSIVGYTVVSDEGPGTVVGCLRVGPFRETYYR